MFQHKEFPKDLAGRMAPMNASLVAHLKSTDGTDAAVRISNENTCISVDAATGNELTRSVRTKPRHNEEGILTVSGILLEKLNRTRTQWSNLRRAECPASDVDCTAQNEAGDVLKMQVTRAEIERSSLWREIGHGNTVSAQRPVTDAVEYLREAVFEKSKLPLQQKKELLLVLDAIETPDLAFTQTVESFRMIYGAWAKGLGFRGIWVVGPTEDLVHRLDD
jgi:hypothetical protein